MKLRNFIVKIHEKPTEHRIQAKDKKDAEQEARHKFSMGGDPKRIHKIKVFNDTDPEFYSTPLIST